MRILYFSRDYTTHDYRFLAKISERHEVFFLRLKADGAGYEERPLPEGVHLVSWAAGKGRFTSPESWMKLMPVYSKVIEQVRPDLIQAGPVQSCGFMTALAGFHPFLLMSWGSDILVDSDRDELWEWITRFSLSRSDALLCDCGEVRAKAGRLAARKPGYIVQFPWGIDVDKFSPGRGTLMRDREGWEHAQIVITTRLWREDYGTDVLLDAFRIACEREPKLRLAMLGGGPFAPTVRSYVAQNQLSDVVQLVGRKPEEEIPEYFRSADIYLSCAPSDGSSISLLQAMACGLPPIVADRPSNREWVEAGKNGWLAGAGDPHSFATALIAAARMDAGRKRSMAAQNRQITCLKANWNLNFPKLLDVYEHLMKEQNPQPS